MDYTHNAKSMARCDTLTDCHSSDLDLKLPLMTQIFSSPFWWICVFIKYHIPTLLQPHPKVINSETNAESTQPQPSIDETASKLTEASLPRNEFVDETKEVRNRLYILSPAPKSFSVAWYFSLIIIICPIGVVHMHAYKILEWGNNCFLTCWSS